MPDEWMQVLKSGSPSMTINELEDYKHILPGTDVLYMTRVQQERFDSPEAYDAVKNSFVLKSSDLAESKAIVMHPLPRVNEIDTAVDALPNAKYFEQVAYGVIMRSALLGLALGAV